MPSAEIILADYESNRYLGTLPLASVPSPEPEIEP